MHSVARGDAELPSVARGCCSFLHSSREALIGQGSSGRAVYPLMDAASSVDK